MGRNGADTPELIRERRIAILSFLYQVRVAKTDQLLRLFFHGRNEAWSRRILNQMVKDGLLQAWDGAWESYRAKYFQLAGAGFDELGFYYQLYTEGSPAWQKKRERMSAMVSGITYHQILLNDMVIDFFEEADWRRWAELCPVYRDIRLFYTDAGRNTRILIPDFLVEHGTTDYTKWLHGQRDKNRDWFMFEMDTGAEKRRKLDEKFENYQAYFSNPEVRSDSLGKRYILFGLVAKYDTYRYFVRTQTTRSSALSKLSDALKGIYTERGMRVQQDEPQVDLLIGKPEDVARYAGSVLLQPEHPDLQAARFIAEHATQEGIATQVTDHVPKIENLYTGHALIRIDNQNTFRMYALVVDMRFRLTWKLFQRELTAYTHQLSSQMGGNGTRIGILALIRRGEEAYLTPQSGLVACAEEDLLEGNLLDALRIGQKNSQNGVEWRTVNQIIANRQQSQASSTS